MMKRKSGEMFLAFYVNTGLWIRFFDTQNIITACSTNILMSVYLNVEALQCSVRPFDIRNCTIRKTVVFSTLSAKW